MRRLAIPALLLCVLAAGLSNATPTLSFAPNLAIADHFWWPSYPSAYSEMLSLTVTAGLTEHVMWNSIRLESSGYGDDSTDISSVSVWIDTNDNGLVDAADQFLGSGFYWTDDAPVTISFTSPFVIPAGGSIDALVAYTMSGFGWPCADYELSATAATGIGWSSGGSAAISGLPIAGATVMMAPNPVSIPAVKLQQPGAAGIAFLHDKIVTAYIQAGGESTWDQLHIEEDDRSGGIAVLIPTQGSPIAAVGDRISVDGVAFGSTAEAMLFGDCWAREPSHGSVPKPIGANNKVSGGGAFGLQQAVTNDATAVPPTNATGLSSIGLLARLYGKVTGSGQMVYGGVTRNVVWIDDGSALRDGFTFANGQPSLGVAVLIPMGMTVPATGTTWAATGAMSAIYSASLPVRFLLPRTSADLRRF